MGIDISPEKSNHYSVSLNRVMARHYGLHDLLYAEVINMTLNWSSLDRWITGEAWVGSKINDHLTVLCDDIGPRWATSENETRAVDYILDQRRLQGLSNVCSEKFVHRPSLC